MSVRVQCSICRRWFRDDELDDVVKMRRYLDDGYSICTSCRAPATRRLPTLAEARAGRGSQLLMEVRCGRCGQQVADHCTVAGHFVGCPETEEPRPCAYQSCEQVEIANVHLWLCAEHLPRFAR